MSRSMTAGRSFFSRAFLRCVLATSLVVGSGAATRADDGEPAITRRADVDADFAYMGEYLGTLEVPSGSPTSFGLQVIPLGDQKFTATLLTGGLPGNGALLSSSHRVTLDGQRDGQLLTLEAPEWKLELQDRTARIVTAPHGWTGILAHVTRRSQREGAPPLPGAYILFDGRSAGAFKEAKIVDGLLQCGTDLLPQFQDYLMHVEFLVPYMPRSNSQARGNSGVYLQSRYEIQILDTFGREGLANECGGLYKQRAPDVNMAFPPLSWQTYDITFHSPRFDSCGRKTHNARLTVLHNGVVVHQDIEIQAKTGAGQPEAPHLLPTKLQDHGNPVQFKNIWLLDLNARQ